MNGKLRTCVVLSTIAAFACGGDDGAAGAGSAASASSSSSAPAAAEPAAGAAGTAVGAPSPLTQSVLDAIGSSTQVTFSVLENIPMVGAEGAKKADCPESTAGLCFDAVIALKNGGPAWNATGWAIYFSNVRKVATSSSPEFAVTQIEGDLHKIEPTAAFKGFAAGETKQISLKAPFWMISESDVMPRWYVAASGLTPVLIANTNTEDVASFTTPFAEPKQTLRTPDDKSVIETANTRYQENAPVADLPASVVAAEIVPTPRMVTKGSGSLDLAAGVTLTTSAPTDVNADGLASVKARLSALGIAVKDAGGVAVRVSVNPADAAFSGKSTAEAYALRVTAGGVDIIGGDAAGAFYGLQTLVGLVPADAASAPSIPLLTVDYDAPRYAYRGAQLDLPRHFQSADEVRKITEQLAAYKLNVLHLRLGDDEGWRLEIPGLPELTSVGSRVCHDLEEKTCLLPQLGSGPDSSTSGSGQLTRAQFVDILKFAAARYIEVIPEFDMPGHARAAIVSMQARGDAAYRLSDPDDTSKYESVQYYHHNAINACMESSYAFVAKVMDEVKAMYTDAGLVLKTWHVGADEVPEGAWVDSPVCKALYASSASVKSADDVHTYFVQRVNALAKERGLGIRGWSDGLRKNVATGEAGGTTKQLLDPVADLDGNAVSVNWWGTLFWWDRSNSAYAMANQGYKVILTHPDFLYFDHPYEADPKERGYYWATRYTDVRKLFGYISGNLPANSKLSVGRMGEDYQAAFDPTTADPTPRVDLSPAGAANIIGLEGAQWGETIRTATELESMIFPRLLALSERAWHRAAWEPADVSGTDWGKAVPIDTAGLAADWARFASLLGRKELPKLGKQGIEYRIEVPGATIDAGGVLRANVSLPGLGIEYKNGESWVAYDPAAPPTLTSTEVRARTSEGRTGRAVPVTR